MMTNFAASCRKAAVVTIVSLSAAMALPAAAQEIQTIDPDAVIDADLNGDTAELPPQAEAETVGGEWDGPAYETSEATPRYGSEDARPRLDLPPLEGEEPVEVASAETVDTTVPQEPARTTYAEDDLIGAAEGLFGKGAEGLARLIQNILADQGEPNGYIVGREGGGAFVLGVRYGSGTLYHAVEGNMPVYWTGPSIGPDVGANAGSTFVLVYNLYDTDELYERYPAGEGQAYFVGGFTASYVRKGDVVMIPIRVGAGLRLGVNAGYMRFSRNQRWVPF